MKRTALAAAARSAALIAAVAALLSSAVAALPGVAGSAAAQSAGASAPATAPAAADPGGEPLVRTSTLGPVRATISLEPPRPVIGDTLSLVIEVVAEPDVEVLMPAFGEALGRFVILAYAASDRLDEEGRTVHRQNYSLDVPMSGEWSIPSLIVEFVDRRPGQRPAPEGEDAYELSTEPIAFAVASLVPADADSDLVPPLGELPPLPTRLERARPWIGGGLILAAIALAAVAYFVRAGRRRLRRSAYEIALARLRQLQKLPRVTPEEIDRFFVELSAVVRRYLEDRYEIRAPESTTEEFLERASHAPALAREHRELLVSFLRRADLVKFARSIPGDLEIAESVRSAERFLEETREDAPLLEVVPGGRR